MFKIDPTDFPEYAGVKCKPVYDGEKKAPEQDDIIKTIFAPDPLSGVPRSDMSLMLSKDTSPVVQQYIRDTLQRPVNSQQNLGVTEEDADFALASMKSAFESRQDYYQRLQTLCQPQQKEK